MNKQNTKDVLLKLLSEQLKSYDFVLNKKDAEFVKKDQEGWLKYQLIFLNRDAGWEINLGMLIRKNIIENIYHQASYFEPKYHETTPTLGITVENFINNNKEYRCYLRSEKDIQTCLEFVMQTFTKIALPFFEKYNNIEEMDKAINIKSGNSIFSGLKYGGTLGIILAKLTKNRDYEFFLNKYWKYYADFSNGFYLPEYEKLVKVISTLEK